ncbi:MAG TPA: MASE1 domain-containing protein [Microvirga sp.]|jgi:PAS domain S-box-containing protein|nr:MASE1 domain-containing protein [Microvirga sp.]
MSLPSSSPTARGPIQGAALALLVGLSVFAAAWVSIELTRSTGRVAAIWLSNAFLLVALLRSPLRRWTLILIFGLAGNLAANLLHADPPLVALGLVACNGIEILVCAAGLRVLCAGHVPDLGQPRTLASFFVLGAGVAPALSAGLAAVFLSATAQAEPLQVFATWYAADALGLLIVAPVLLSVRAGEFRVLVAPETRATVLLAFAGLIAALGIVFVQTRYPLLFLVFPLLVLIAFRLGMAGATLGLALTAAVALAATALDLGPIAAVEGGMREHVIVLQVFVGVAALTSLKVASVLAERDRLVHDLTSAKGEAERAAEAMQSREAHHRAVLDGLPQKVWTADPDGRASYYNQRILDYHGDLGPGLEDRVRLNHPDDERRMLEVRESSMAGGQAFEVEGRLANRLGEYRWHRLSMAPLRDERGEIVEWVGTSLDIHDLKVTKERLRESEASFRLLAENATDVVLLHRPDPGEAPLYVSPSCERVLGYAPRELADTSLADLLHPADRAAHAGDVAGLTASRQAATAVYRMRCKGGHWIWVEAVTSLVEGSGEDTLITSLRDVTERQQQAQELISSREIAELALAQARNASQAKTDFLASMSHEIRSPLNGILGFAELLAEDRTLGPEQRREVERIQSAGQALLTLVNDILDFSKIEAGQIDLEPLPFSLTDLVEGTIGIVEAQARRKGLDVRVTLDSNAPTGLMGDEMRLRQVLLNFLNNAVKFTAKGSVSLDVTLKGEDEHGAVLLFEVRDTGIGIPDDKINRLFKRFSQVDGSITRQFGGTGLGLAICKRLVELMGGQVGVVSAEGVGSTFWFRVVLPRTEAPPTRLSHEAAVAHAHVPKARILLVDDIELNRDLAGKILREVGHEVDAACDGLEAIAAVQAKIYDVVLMDVQMPVMDGITAVEKIRALQHPCRNVPVIALTANVLQSQVAQLRAAGMNDHVGKPFKKAELLSVVERWLSDLVMVSDPAGADMIEASFERAVYDDLRDTVGDRITEWLDKLGELLLSDRLAEAAVLGDPKRAAGLAHMVVSTGGMLGFHALSEAARALEEACLGNDHVACRYAAFDATRADALMRSEALKAEGLTRNAA